MSISFDYLKRFASSISLVAAAVALVPMDSILAQELRPFTGEHEVHVMPPPGKASAMAGVPAVSSMPMTYHGGPVMTSAQSYAIYWIPSALQNGAATSLPARATVPGSYRSCVSALPFSEPAILRL